MRSNKDFNVLNDYFMRYMFAKEGHEHILKNLINSVRIDSNQEPFEYIEVLNTFNLKENVIITGGDGTKENPFTLSVQ